MKIKRPFAPSFLNKLDAWLLLHRPETWGNRTHLMTWYALLLMLALAALSFVVPDDPRSRSDAGYWVSFAIIVSILGLVAWLIYLLRFNVFKRYGGISRWSGTTTYIQYFICVGLIVLFPYVQPAVETARANAAYGDEELVKDVNTFNQSIIQLEFDSLDHYWHPDTFVLRETYTGTEPVNGIVVEETAGTGEMYDTITVVTVPSPRKFMNKENLRHQITARDSTLQLNDSLYVFYSAPHYTFLDVYMHGSPSLKIQNSYELYHNTVKNFTRPNRAAVQKKMDSLIKKYFYSDWSYAHGFAYADYSVSLNGTEEEYAYRRTQRYQINDIRNSVENIAERKYRFSPMNLEWQVRIFFYITLGLSLLVFLFRHSTRRVFFLSLLSAVILTILTAIFTAFSRSETSALYLVLFYFIVFFSVSLSIWKEKRRSLTAGISLNLWVFMLPVIPLLGLIAFCTTMRERFDSGSERYEYYSDLLQNNIPYMEIAGFLILLILSGAYIRKAYRQWYALPEE